MIDVNSILLGLVIIVVWCVIPYFMIIQFGLVTFIVYLASLFGLGVYVNNPSFYHNFFAKFERGRFPC